MSYKLNKLSISLFWLLLFFACYFQYAKAQTLEWEANIFHSVTTTDPNDRIAAFDVVEDDNGNVIVCGGHRGIHDFDPGPNEVVTVSGPKGPINIFDIFVAKYTPTGDLMWVITAGDNPDDNRAQSVDVDAAGNVYVTGKFTGTVDFDPSPGVYNLTATSGDGDLFVVKYSPAGAIIWGMVIQGTTNFRQSGYDLDVNDAAGRFVIGARLDDPVDIDPMDPGNTVSFSTGGEDAGILTYDLDGNYIYGFNYNDPSGGGYTAVEMDDLGNVYAFLVVYSFADIDPGPSPVAIMGQAGVIIKYDPSGNYLWHRDFSGNITSGNIELDPCDNIIISGNVAGSAQTQIDFESGNPASQYNGDGSSRNMFVAKYTENGDFVWLRHSDNGGNGTTRIGSVGVNSYYNGGMALDKDGDIYIVGSTDAALSLDGNTITGSGNRGYIVKYDRNGIYQWSGVSQPSGWALGWLMNVSVGDDYSVSAFGKSSNEMIAPFGGAGSGASGQNAYTYHISQVIVPLNPEIEYAQTTQCSSDTVNFSIINDIPDSVFWNFGDPLSATNSAIGINASHVYSSQGVYNVEAIVYFGCIPDTLDTLVTVNFSIPPLDLGNDTIICEGEQVTLDATLSGALSYNWSTTETTATITADTSGTYLVDVDMGNNCVLTDSVNVLVQPLPDAGNDSIVDYCLITNDSIQLSDYITTSQAGMWFHGSFVGSGQLDVHTGALASLALGNETNNFQYIIPGAGSCAGDTAFITLTTQIMPSAGADSMIQLCGVPGGMEDLNTLLTTTELGNWAEVSNSVSGQFDSINGILDVSGLNNTYLFEYEVQGVNACLGETDVAMIELQIEEQTSAGTDTLLNWCDSYANLDLNNLLSGNTSTGNWFDNNGAVSATFNVDTLVGLYQFSFVTGGFAQCLDTALIDIDLGHTGDAGLDNAITVCYSQGLVNLVDELGGTPDLNGTWSPSPQGGASFDPLTDHPGIYNYVAAGTGVCPNDTSELEIFVINYDSLDVQSESLICEEVPQTTLIANIPGGTWSGDAAVHPVTGVVDLTGLEVGEYTFVYSVDSLGCSNSESTTFFINSLPKLELDDTTTICAEKTSYILADVQFANTFSWSTGETTEILELHPEYIGEASTLEITATASNECGVATDSIFITIEDCEIYVFVPNTFTPDGNEFNQAFTPQLTGHDFGQYVLTIFNRWGERLFVSHDVAVGWDGTYMGEICQSGTYVWKIEYDDKRSGKRVNKYGNVSLIK